MKQNKDKDKDWYAQQLVSKDVPLIDVGEGRPIIIRDFRFAMRANLVVPTNQMLFNSHWAYIKQSLWADGLQANEDYPPRVVVGKLAYRIFIVCEVRGGQVRSGKMKDKAKKINQILDKKQKEE